MARLLRLLMSARPCWGKVKAVKLKALVLLRDFDSLSLSLRLVLAFSLAASSLIALTWLNACPGSGIVTRAVTGQAFKQKPHSVFLKRIASRSPRLLEQFFFSIKGQLHHFATVLCEIVIPGVIYYIYFQRLKHCE